MHVKSIIRKYTLPLILILCAVLFIYFFWGSITRLYLIISDREKVQVYIASYGMGAPFVFMLVQILQVVLAPVPGEASGFVGGYLFGTTFGFFYSTIGLGIGSGLNFWIGRFAGIKLIRKVVSAKRMKKYDGFFERQGTLLLLILFVFPGFPKDILSILAGLSSLPFKIFIMIATVGRMPGTFLLSLQGEFLFNKNYGVLLASMIICICLAIICIRYRGAIYQWLEKNE